MKPSARSHSSSFDLIRIFALLIVVVQHWLTTIDCEKYTILSGSSLGQYGVSIFCILSGYLALSDCRDPLDWLKRRLFRIYPAFWATMLLCFILNLFIKYKSVSIFQFISQMLGLGYFTHGWKMLNVVTWFISLILLCYCLTFIAKLIRLPKLAFVGFIFISVLLICFRIEVTCSQHVISFCLAGLSGLLFVKRSPHHYSIFIIPLFILSYFWISFIYAAVGMTILYFAMIFESPSFRFLKLGSAYSYEAYLVHGMVFKIASVLVHKSMILTGALGLILTLFLAVPLKLILDKQLYARYKFV
jgi:peptidoglycan/LPS O-acetylase OafA/YrhL